MKNTLISVFIFSLVPVQYHPLPPKTVQTEPVSENVFVITTDGFRWQEVFTGADSLLINNENYTPDTSTLKALYWDDSPSIRRKKLMPFLWNVINTKGRLYGNRLLKNKMDVLNGYAKSYPGYNEMFTGTDDMSISSNDPVLNPNINIFEFLNKQTGFHGKIAAFTSWNVFPFILNRDRSGLWINAGYEKDESPVLSGKQSMINKVQDDAVTVKTETRYDQLTYLTAKEFINQHKPSVLFLGFGETDEFAHQGRYDLYLDQANQVDKMIAELWHWVQTTPGYKDHTTFIITTDHGRGSRTSKWTSHGEWIRGSSQTWLAVIGPGISPLGEIKENQQIYQAQLARTISEILGVHFTSDEAAPAITLR